MEEDVDLMERNILQITIAISHVETQQIDLSLREEMDIFTLLNLMTK